MIHGPYNINGRLYKHRLESLKSWPLPSTSCPTNSHFLHHRFRIVWATDRVVKQTANKTTYFFLFFLLSWTWRKPRCHSLNPVCGISYSIFRGLKLLKTRTEFQYKKGCGQHCCASLLKGEQPLLVTRAAKCLHFQLDIWFRSASLRYATKHIR